MDYTATATLVGPISDAEAGRIVRRLRDYQASSCASGQADRLDVTFFLRAGSSREAVIRALSLSDDLGPPVAHLHVDPTDNGNRP